MSMGGGESHTTTTQELSPEQRALIAPVIPIAQRYLANPPSLYPKSGIAPFNPLQQQAQQMTVSAANSMLPQLNKLPGQVNSINAGYAAMAPQYSKLMGQNDFLTSGAVLRPESNPALQGAIEAASRPTIDNFNNSILPGLKSDALTAGGFGGTRQGIGEGLAAKGATQTIGDIAARMANENYQAGLGAMTQGFGNANNLLAGQQGALSGQQNLAQNTGNILSQTLLPAQLKESVGAQQGAMQQAQLSEQVQKYVNQQMIPFSAAQDVAAMAFGMPGGTTNSTSTQPGNPMVGAQMATGALSMLPMLAGSSDRRLKENVIKVKTLLDGLIVYVFNYIGHVGRTIGLMADEVGGVYPEAVFDDSNGYKKVRYLCIPTWVGMDMRMEQGAY